MFELTCDVRSPLHAHVRVGVGSSRPLNLMLFCHKSKKLPCHTDNLSLCAHKTNPYCVAYISDPGFVSFSGKDRRLVADEPVEFKK